MMDVPLVQEMLGAGRLPAVRQDTCVLMPAVNVSRRPCIVMNSGGTVKGEREREAGKDQVN